MPSLSLPKKTGVNFPLLCNLFFCPERFTTIATPYYGSPDISEIATSTPPGEVDDAYFYGMYFTPDTEQIEISGDGQGHSCQATFFFPSDTNTLTEWLNRVIDDRHLLIYRDDMGEWKVLGETKNGCRLSYKFVNRSGIRGYTFSFQVETAQPVRHFVGELRTETGYPDLGGIGYWIISDDDFVVE